MKIKCSHDFDKIGVGNYGIKYWCKLCGALKTLYIGAGAEEFIRLPGEKTKDCDTGPR